MQKASRAVHVLSGKHGGEEGGIKQLRNTIPCSNKQRCVGSEGQTHIH